MLWRSSDERVAVVHGSADGAIIDAVGEGTAVLSVVHVPSGVTSTASGGDAVLTVVWPLEKLTISPPAGRKKIGDFEEYTVTGHFTGGTTLNLTQRVTYAVTNEFVARSGLVPNRKSLVRAIGDGVTYIAATDPVTGVSTTEAGNDAVLRVGDPPLYVEIEPTALWQVALRVGDVDRLTAVAYLFNGSTRNVTQECLWESSNPEVARMPNEDGDRSRLEAVAPGSAIITCKDAQGRIDRRRCRQRRVGGTRAAQRTIAAAS